MNGINSTNTSGSHGACIAVFEWWLARSQFLICSALLLERTPDEAFTRLNDVHVGRVCCRERDAWAQLQRDIQADPCAKFIFDTYGGVYDFEKWLYETVGTTIKNLPTWESRLPGIKQAQAKLRAVKSVLET